MTERARREYAAALRERYRAANKRGKGQILDEYCRTTGCHRKAAIRRLRQVAPAATRPPTANGCEVLPCSSKCGRPAITLCGKLLAPMIGPLLTSSKSSSKTTAAWPLSSRLTGFRRRPATSPTIPPWPQRRFT